MNDRIPPRSGARIASTLLRILVWGLVVAAAFYLGARYRSSAISAGNSPNGDPQAQISRAEVGRAEVGRASDARGSDPEGSIPSAAALRQPRPADLDEGFTESERRTISLFRQASPSVVYIDALQVRNYRMRVLEVPRGSGSGFVWDREGHIITNFHVIANQTNKVNVTLADGSVWEARYVGGAQEKDLAVLKIDAPKKLLEPIRVGRSEPLLVGQSVYAIGNPFGLDYTLTTGVISALGREIESLDRTPIPDVIQTDAAINPGNSGGPLLDSSGRLIGVNTQIYSPSGASAGIGFAIPVDTVNWVVDDLIRYGAIQRPQLGVQLIRDDLVRRYNLKGAAIAEVVKGTGAAEAGLQGIQRTRRGDRFGDIIVGINDKAVDSTNELRLALEDYKPGDVVRVTVDRNGDKVTVPVRLSGSN